ncbi:Lactation elevated protein 1 [Hordeum vulgare]|nr:Lactation elevated protein 1 [Hordeum vulgare]
MLSPVTVEVAHAPSPRADLVVGHVSSAAVAQAHTAPSRKRQGNVVVQGGNLAAPAATARAPGANAAVRSRPTAEKAGKAAGVKRRKVSASRKPPYSTSDFTPQGGAPAMPFNDAAPPASEVFDEMAGSGGSNNATTEFVNMLDTNAVDIDQASFKPFEYNEKDGNMDDHGSCLEEVRNAPPSGTVEYDYDKIAQHRYKDMEASEGKFFKLEHCWELLQKCEKWKLIDKESPLKRGSLINMDEDGPRNLHKPDGDRKTKEKMKREQEATSLREKIDAKVQSNELMLLKSLEIKKELAEKKAKEKQEKWQMLKEEGLRKAAIEERKACVSENKSMSLLLTEENKIMSMNRNNMKDLTKTWHDMARREILKRRMVASAGPCSSSGDVFSAPYDANVDDFGARVGTSDGGGFGGADELQYGLHGAE